MLQYFTEAEALFLDEHRTLVRLVSQRESLKLVCADGNLLVEFLTSSGIFIFESAHVVKTDFIDLLNQDGDPVEGKIRPETHHVGFGGITGDNGDNVSVLANKDVIEFITYSGDYCDKDRSCSQCVVKLCSFQGVA